MNNVTDIKTKQKLKLNDGHHEMRMNKLIIEKDFLMVSLKYINDDKIDEMIAYAEYNGMLNTVQITELRELIWNRAEIVVNQMIALKNSKGE